MARFEHLVLVCTNARDPAQGRRDCAGGGGDALLARLKELVAEHRLKGRVRVTRSGCLDFCAKGCALAIFSARVPQPETWYTHLGPTDADALFDSHIVRGELFAAKVQPRPNKPGDQDG